MLHVHPKRSNLIIMVSNTSILSTKIQKKLLILLRPSSSFPALGSSFRRSGSPRFQSFLQLHDRVFHLQHLFWLHQACFPKDVYMHLFKQIRMNCQCLRLQMYLEVKAPYVPQIGNSQIGLTFTWCCRMLGSVLQMITRLYCSGFDYIFMLFWHLQYLDH